MRKIICLLCVFGLILLNSASLEAQSDQPTVALNKVNPRTHLFKNCTLVVKPDQVLKDGILIIRDGRIEYVGKKVSTPKDALVHDLNGAWIYPGFIDPFADFGVAKKKSASDNQPQYHSKKKGPYYWNESVNAEKEVTADFKYDSDKAESYRSAGFTSLHVVARDGIFRGQSMMINLRSHRGTGFLLQKNVAVGMSFDKGSSRQAYPRSIMGAMALIRQVFYDAEWYAEARPAWLKGEGTEVKEDLSLEAVNRSLSQGKIWLFETGNANNTLRASRLMKEFNLDAIYKTNGRDFHRLDELAAAKVKLIVPLEFKAAMDLTDPADANSITLRQLREWELRPANAALLKKKNITFAFTANGLDKMADLQKKIREAIKCGLSKEEALDALTLQPAKLFGVDSLIGTLEKGKLANFFISSDNYFEEDAEIYQTWVGGNKFIIKSDNAIDIRGSYEFKIDSLSFSLKISGDQKSPKSSITLVGDSTEIKGKIIQKKEGLVLHFKAVDSLKFSGLRLAGIATDDKISGTGLDGKGNSFSWKTSRIEKAKEKDEKKKETTEWTQVSNITSPNRAYGWKRLPKAENVLIKGATVWTNGKEGRIENADVLIKEGKINAVGKGLAASGSKVVDGKGMHLTPGIIDEHSHIAIQGGVNEGSHNVTAEVRIGDAVNPDDINIYRQLAGGVTTSQLLHGSANPIGGQSAIVKLRWGRSSEEMKFKEAPGFIKFALGENVKQSNWGEQYRTRYPQSRTGVEQVYVNAFSAAKNYRQSWAKFKEGKSKVAPAKDLQMECLLEILDGKRFITCHSYVQSEINMLMKTSEKMGFKVNTFTHILEGYKVADKLKTYGAHASTFSDWWAYKYEVIDAIPYNASLMNEVGVNVMINSDDREMGRRLNQEAAKAIKYGGASEEDALKMVTLNPAKALHIDDYVGSIEVGKHADMVLWTDHPLSVYAKVSKTFIDGICYYDHSEDKKMREELKIEKAALIAKMESSGEGEGKPGKVKEKNYECDTILEDYLDYED